MKELIDFINSQLLIFARKKRLICVLQWGIVIGSPLVRDCKYNGILVPVWVVTASVLCFFAIWQDDNGWDEGGGRNITIPPPDPGIKKDLDGNLKNKERDLVTA